MTKMKRPIKKLYPLELNEKTDYHRDGLKESRAEETKTDDEKRDDDALYTLRISVSIVLLGRMQGCYMIIKTDNSSMYDDETDNIIDDKINACQIRRVPRRAAALGSDVRRKLISETFE